MKEGRRPGFFSLLCSCFNLGSKKRPNETGNIQKPSSQHPIFEESKVDNITIVYNNKHEENQEAWKRQIPEREEIVEEIKIRRAVTVERIENRESVDSLNSKINKHIMPQSEQYNENVNVIGSMPKAEFIEPGTEPGVEQDVEQEKSLIAQKYYKPVSRQKLPSMASSYSGSRKLLEAQGARKKEERRVYSARHISKKSKEQSNSQSKKKEDHEENSVQKISPFNKSSNIFFDNTNEVLKIPFLENVDPIIIDGMDFKGSPLTEQKMEKNSNEFFQKEKKAHDSNKSSSKPQNEPMNIFTDQSKKPKFPLKKNESIPIAFQLKANSSPSSKEKPESNSKAKRESSAKKPLQVSKAPEKKYNKGIKIENTKRPHTSEGNIARKNENKKPNVLSNNPVRQTFSAEKSKPKFLNSEKEKSLPRKKSSGSNTGNGNVPVKNLNLNSKKVEGKKKPKNAKKNKKLSKGSSPETNTVPTVQKFTSNGSDEMIIIEDFSINERDSKEDSMYFGNDRIDISEEFIPRSKNYELVNIENNLIDDEDDSLNDRSELSEKNDMEYRLMIKRLNAELVMSEPIIQADIVWEPEFKLARRKSL